MNAEKVLSMLTNAVYMVFYMVLFWLSLVAFNCGEYPRAACLMLYALTAQIAKSENKAGAKCE